MLTRSYRDVVTSGEELTSLFTAELTLFDLRKKLV